MEQANRSYQAEDYSTAIRLYESLTQVGIRHSDVYYNLGNAYLQQDALGQAIVNYRRAQQLAPRDRDIAVNLAIARSQTIDRLPPTPQTITVGLAYLTQAWLTVVETELVLLLLWTTLFGWWGGLLMWPTAWRNAIMRFAGRAVLLSLLGLLVLVGGSLGSRLYLDTTLPPVVVTVSEVEVTTGPGYSDRYPVAFRLHAGTEARLLDTQAGWRQIALSNDLRGWLPSEAVTHINPLVE